MDSIYKGFPFGSLLFWRTKTPLKTERNLGPFLLPEGDPDYPLDYILDGQQRATSIFGVFQSFLSPEPGEDDSIFDIYFDLTADSSVQDSNFIYVPADQVKKERHFPLRLLFNPPKYRRYLRDLPEEIAERIDVLFEKFNSARIPIQTFETDDRAAVAIVFERINRMGVELDTLQLLSAWTWSDDFDLQDQFNELAEELAPFGFKDVGEDSDLLLRCCSAVITNDASPKTIIELKGSEVRNRFREIKKGIFGAIDFLKSNCCAYSAGILPYSTIIIPLCVFFSTSAEQDTSPSSHQKEILIQWIWRTFFSRRYSKRLEQLNDDIKLVKELRDTGNSSLGQFSVDFDEGFFLENQFNTNTVNAKAFILLLATARPLSFISGSPVALTDVLREANKKEFHHLYPKKYLADMNMSPKNINALVNFAIINRSENNKLSGSRPSKYRAKMPSNTEALRLILNSALCTESLFDDDFNKFSEERASILVEKAMELMKISKIKPTVG